MFLKPKSPFIPLVVSTFLLGSSIVSANASEITSQTFDADPILSDSQAPGVWFTDRFAPAGFESESFMGDNRLAHTIAEKDGAVNRPSSFDSPFYNTQGRSFLTPGAGSVSIDMYIDSDFDTGRIGGLWGVGVTEGGDFLNDRTAFPIIEFIDGQFQVFDSIDDADGFGFRPVGTPSGFSFDEFVNLEIDLNTSTDSFDFLFDGQLLHSEEAGGTEEIGGVILQNINTEQGINRTIYFDNFTASTPVPLPSTLALLALSLAGLGALMRQRPQ